jgi:hypothetical protein
MPMTKYYIETKDNYISSDSDNSGRSSLNRTKDNEDAHLNDTQSKDNYNNFNGHSVASNTSLLIYQQKCKLFNNLVREFAQTVQEVAALAIVIGLCYRQVREEFF